MKDLIKDYTLFFLGRVLCLRNPFMAMKMGMVVFAV